jgi:hypothetical protein
MARCLNIVKAYNRSNFTARPSIVTAVPLKVTAEHLYAV